MRKFVDVIKLSLAMVFLLAAGVGFLHQGSGEAVAGEGFCKEAGCENGTAPCYSPPQGGTCWGEENQLEN